MKQRYMTAAFALLMLSAPAGFAATFDFEAMADTYKSAHGGKEGNFDQLLAFDPGQFTDGGVSITGMNASYASGNFAEPFFDGGRAGLGVCHTAPAPQSSLSGCSSNGGAAPGDDNVTTGEALSVLFDKMVRITDLLFRNGGHGLLDGTVWVDSRTFDVVDGKIDPDELATIGPVTTLDFEYVTDQFYVSTVTVSPVPLPASMMLLAFGLGGLGLAGRRKAA